MAKAAPKSTALSTWVEKMAEQAKIAQGMQGTVGVGGKFLSLKSGILALGGSPYPTNQVAVVVLDDKLENVYYEGKWDEANPQPPKCFAFGTDAATMRPDQTCVDAGVAEGSTDEDVEAGRADEVGTCKGCPKNEWQSAETGKGKACRNTHRLALLIVGTYSLKGELTLKDDLATYQDQEVVYLRLPVTSTVAWSNYVRGLSQQLARPPHGVITNIQVVPDVKTQFKLVFHGLQNLEDVSEDLVEPIMTRHEQQDQLTAFPYQAWEPAPVAAPPKRAAAPAARPAARVAAPAPRVAKPAARPVAAPRPAPAPAKAAVKGPKKY